MKRLLTIGIAAMLLLGTSCSSTVSSAVERAESNDTIKAQLTSQSVMKGVFDTWEEQRIELAAIAEEQVRIKKLNKNAIKMLEMTEALKGRVGKTPYVFSGSSFSGWDCSGMVRWAYQEYFGITLYHGATVQSRSGTRTEQPKLGDLVVFSYHGSSNAYHVGIYLSEDKMVHSGGRRGHRTSIESISTWAGGYSKVSYVSLVENELAPVVVEAEVVERQPVVAWAMG